jgi:hypothetical protein
MRTQTTVLTAASLSLFIASCGGSDTPNTGGTTGCTSAAVTANPQPTSCSGATIVAKEANNYAFTSTIKLPPVTVKSMTNLTFDWSAVTKDFLGHSLSPTADLNTQALLLWALPLTELESKLNADTLSMLDLEVSPPPSWPAPGMSTGGMTSAPLYSFTINGTEVPQADYNMFFDPARYPSAMYTYMIAAATGTTLGQGFRMLQTFKLDAGSSATNVALTNSSTQMTCQVSLRNLTITGAPGGNANLMLDFTDLVTRMAPNALGGTFKEAYITSAVVGHFTETPEQLEKKFLDLDMIAQKYYRANIESGSVLNFSTLKDSSGASFPGIDDTGTWMVGLICGNCRNPAPWYMTILKPCTAS